MPPRNINRKKTDTLKAGTKTTLPTRKISDSESSSDEQVPLKKKTGVFSKLVSLSASEEESSDNTSSDEESSDSASSSDSSHSSESDSSDSTKSEKVPPVVAKKPATKISSPQLPKCQSPPKKSQPKAKAVDDDLDALLASIEAPVAKAAPKAAPKAKSVAKAKAPPHKKGKLNDDDDLNALLADMCLSSQPEESTDIKLETKSKAKSKTKPETEAKSGTILVETKEKSSSPIVDDELDEAKGEAVSSKTLKNRLKKLKKKQGTNAEENEEGEAPAPLPKSKAKAKATPKSAAALLAQKRMLAMQEAEKQREEEERRAKEEEARLEAEEKEQLRLAEEEKARKRLAKAEKKERQKKEGKPLTAAAKEKARKAELARQQLLGTINVDAFSTEPQEEKKKSRVIKDRKKKKVLVPVAEPVVTIPVVEKVEETTSTPAEDVPMKIEPERNDEDRFSDRSDWEDDTKPVSAQPDTEQVDSESDSDQSALQVKVKEVQAPPAPIKSKDITSLSRQELQSAKLRSPICCILGHVDTGKTKLLDKIRHTNVQCNEAGGITQQIGATFFPKDALWEQCKKIEPQMDMRVPGLLIIDTPGHESFNNLRARGSSLCDIAILVVDIMHGLEPQTRESLGLLKARKCPFVVALNKIDRLYGWASMAWGPAQKSIKAQKESTQDEFKKRADDAILQLSEEGFNCSIWWTIDNVRNTVSVAPTSAITGEGIPDLLLLLVKLTQSVMTRALVFREEFQCTILEVKSIEGLGTTIDVVLVSGTLRENDRLVICGMDGPIVSTVRALLTPHPLKELRVKGDYIHHKEIHAAMGVKISAQGLEEAVAGTSVLVARNVDDEQLEIMKDDVMADMSEIFKSVDKSGEGVYVMASTLGSLEALLQFLKTSKIPVFAVNLGVVHKLDVKKASVMREKGHPELSCILAFDVKVEPDAVKEAQTLGVKIFTADIIYHLFDAFNNYLAEEKEAKRKEMAAEAVFPCILSILPDCVFNKKDPIILGIKVDEGILRVGSPLCIPEKDVWISIVDDHYRMLSTQGLFIGRVTSLEHNKKAVDQAKRGTEVAVKISGDSSIMVGRHFDQTHKLYSKITRESINCLKELFREDMSNDDWRLVNKLKKVFKIM